MGIFDRLHYSCVPQMYLSLCVSLAALLKSRVYRLYASSIYGYLDDEDDECM